MAAAETTADVESENDPPEPDPWQNRVPVLARGGERYADLITSTRTYLANLAAANAPSHVIAEVAQRIHEAAELLAPYEVHESDAPIGTRIDLPGRGHPLLPPFITDEWGRSLVRGRVTYTRFYLGGNNAAHGGTLPLLFDEVLGRLANTDRPVARTAFLHVNFRHITQIGHELRLEATVDREEGRKRFVTGRLYDGDTLVADAEALFVALNPGQP